VQATCHLENWRAVPQNFKRICDLYGAMRTAVCFLHTVDIKSMDRYMKYGTKGCSPRHAEAVCEESPLQG
jgi:hypothetical protein